MLSIILVEFWSPPGLDNHDRRKGHSNILKHFQWLCWSRPHIKTCRLHTCTLVAFIVTHHQTPSQHIHNTATKKRPKDLLFELRRMRFSTHFATHRHMYTLCALFRIRCTHSAHVQMVVIAIGATFQILVLSCVLLQLRYRWYNVDSRGYRFPFKGPTGEQT